MSDYISKSTVIELIESKMTDRCLGTEEDTFIGGHGLVDDISDLPTFDEKEIIRKAFERVVERLKQEGKSHARYSVNTEGIPSIPTYSAIKILKEECGINE